MQTSARALSLPPEAPVRTRTGMFLARATSAARQTLEEFPDVLRAASTSPARPNASINWAKTNSGSTSLLNDVASEGNPVNGMTGNAHWRRAAISDGNPWRIEVESGL